MNLYIYSIFNFINYNNVKLINIFLKNKIFSVMKNHLKFICNISKINFFINNKVINILLYNSIIINKENLKIICDKYEFL